MTSASSSNEATNQRPKLIVFDLDYTLWPFWVDTHVTPPFHKSDDGKFILDTHNWKVKHYPEVPIILNELTSSGCKIGIASRTSAIQTAETLLKLFDWNKYISFKQIFPGCKVTHFVNIKKDSGLEYSDMIFFDDEHRNIKDIQRLGVTSILVTRDGVSRKVIEQGFAEFAAKTR